MRKTSVYLPEGLKEALAARAVASGRSEAQLLRSAIERELAGAIPAERLIERGAHSCRRLGQLVGVGVGPGEPDLLTSRAISVLRRADRVVAPCTAIDAVGRAEAVLRQALPGLRVQRLSFDMSPSPSARDRSVEQAAEVICDYLDAGEEVAFVTLGDPLTYSTFSSVAAAVTHKRPEAIVAQVPGIMAFQALAARTGSVIADERQRFVVATALSADDVAGEDFASLLADTATTVVVYKGGRHLPELAKAVAAAERQAWAGELLGMPGEHVSGLAEMAERGPASYLATVIVPATRTEPHQPRISLSATHQALPEQALPEQAAPGMRT